jgi:hypothetical protein
MNFETMTALLLFATLIMLWAVAPTESPSARPTRPALVPYEALA